MSINIWLDDIRDPISNGWFIVKTVKECKKVLLKHSVRLMSLDHDLGEGQETGYDLLCWMEKNNIWPSEEVLIHTMNPVGRLRMEQVLAKRKVIDR